MLMPVGTSIRSPGLIVKSIRVAKSAPASPAFAYEGSGTVGSKRLIKILVMGLCRNLGQQMPLTLDAALDDLYIAQ
jgi:hypothetical protein